MIIELLKASMAGPISYRIFSGLLMTWIFIWVIWGTKIAQKKGRDREQKQEKYSEEASHDRQEKHDNLSSKIDKSNEILKNLDNKIDEIGSNTYSSLSLSLQKEIDGNLTNLAKKHGTNTKIIIEIESGNNNRHKVASDLGRLLTTINLGSYPSGNTYMGRFPDHAITILSSPENIKFVSEFITAIKPYFNSDIFIDKNFRSQEFVKMYINGNPVFYAEGRLEIQ